MHYKLHHTAGFLSLGTIETLDQMILCGGRLCCALRYGEQQPWPFVLHPLEAQSSQDNPKYLQIFSRAPGDQNQPRLRIPKQEKCSVSVVEFDYVRMLLVACKLGFKNQFSIHLLLPLLCSISSNFHIFYYCGEERYGESNFHC